MPKPVLVIDLDGTLLRGNSYPVWVKTMLFARFAHLNVARRARLRLQALGLLAARKVLRWRHARIKGVFRHVWVDATRTDVEGAVLATLLIQLEADIRPWFKPLLARIAEGVEDAILATAAAGEYAIPLGRRMGFCEILSTQRPMENLGEVKADTVAHRIKSLGWTDRPLVVLTDHADDLPLIRMAHYLVWFGAADALPKIIEAVPGLHAVAAERLAVETFIRQMETDDFSS